MGPFGPANKEPKVQTTHAGAGRSQNTSQDTLRNLFLTLRSVPSSLKDPLKHFFSLPLLTSYTLEKGKNPNVTLSSVRKLNFPPEVLSHNLPKATGE